MFDKILDLLSNLGLPGLFAGVFLEALGLPFPGSLLVGLAGFMSKQGEINIVLAWLVSLVAYLIGSVSAFLVGKHIGEPFIKHWGRYLLVTPERFEKAQELLQKSAPEVIIGGRFIPTVGNITPYVAGISGMSMLRFLIFDMIHALLWLTTFLGAGALLGKNWPRLMNQQIGKWLWLAGGLFVVVLVFRHVLPTLHKKKV